MYIDSIALASFRTFQKTQVHFVHPDQDYKRKDGINVPRPKLRNVNLLLGNNGAGKTTLLKAIAIAALGPAVGDANLPIYRIIRREKGANPYRHSKEATVQATFTPHAQDGFGSSFSYGTLESSAAIVRKGDIERLSWTHTDEKKWHPIFSSENEAFFFVGYGATRRVESRERVDMAARQVSSLGRALRIRSLFEESYSLMPFSVWLPRFETGNKGRFIQVKGLVNLLLKNTGYSFTGAREAGEYLFEKGGLKVPFQALSDGYRGYLGWISDLLYHICETCPSGKKLVENKGIVMVDEIDLHLHPKWQLTVLPTLSRALPNIQFIVTSHSPLIVGSLEWMNIIVMAPGPQASSQAVRIPSAVHGLDADQVLLTDFFGLQSTRAAGKKRTLKDLTLKARYGDDAATKQLLQEMSRGVEEAA